MSIFDDGCLSDADFREACGGGCMYPKCDLDCSGRKRTGEISNSIYIAALLAEKIGAEEEYKTVLKKFKAVLKRQLKLERELYNHGLRGEIS